MATRKAEAVWEGNLREGKGRVKLGGGAFEGPYSFRSRLEEGPGTNPRELIGAAHAGCFTMALSAGLGGLSEGRRLISIHPTSLRARPSGSRPTPCQEPDVPTCDSTVFWGE